MTDRAPLLRVALGEAPTPRGLRDVKRPASVSPRL